MHAGFCKSSHKYPIILKLFLVNLPPIYLKQNYASTLGSCLFIKALIWYTVTVIGHGDPLVYRYSKQKVAK